MTFGNELLRLCTVHYIDSYVLRSISRERGKVGD